METPAIDVHPSVGDEALCRAAIASLEANRIDPKFLYVTANQAELWREVSRKHSPLNDNPEFARIYRDAFAKVRDQFAPQNFLLVGLGCGMGGKELQLYSGLKADGGSILFSAIDVSRDLVAESVKKLVEAGAEHHRSLVCDLGELNFLREWLNAQDADRPRLVTFFGLVPNFPPSVVGRIFKAVLRPGDVLLVSAHLAPARDESSRELAEAMSVVLPQYDNPETLAWIQAALDHWDLSERVGTPRMTIGALEGTPAFLAHADWKQGEAFEKWGRRFSPRIDEPLQLFYSHRYTPARFEDFLRQGGFDAELLSITTCRQEAIWSVRIG